VVLSSNVLQMRTSAFLAQKTSVFFSKFMVVHMDEGGRPFCGRRGRKSQFFAILCERPLWTAP